jgi:hypothetical protein
MKKLNVLSHVYVRIFSFFWGGRLFQKHPVYSNVSRQNKGKLQPQLLLCLIKLHAMKVDL